MTTSLYLNYINLAKLDTTLEIERQWVPSRSTALDNFPIHTFAYVFKDISFSGDAAYAGEWIGIDMPPDEIKRQLLRGIRKVTETFADTHRDHRLIKALIALNTLLVEALELHLTGHHLISINWS